MRTLFEQFHKFTRLAARQRKDYPEEIQLEVTNACNLSCAMCPHTFGDIPQEHFSFDLFTHLVDRNPAPKRLVLTGWGEPLMHPQFFSMIEHANKQWPTTQIRFTTNGILLDAKTRETMARHAIDRIAVSIDLWPEREVRPELQRFLHPSSPKTTRNLAEYYADTKLSEQTPIALQTLVLEDNMQDIHQLLAFAGEQGIPEMNLVRLQPYPGLPIERPTWETEQALIREIKKWGREAHVRVRSLNQQSMFIRFATGFDRICLKTDDSLYILLDGTVTPCCNLRNYMIGKVDVGKLSIADIWQSRKEKEFFSNQNSICGRCDALFHQYRK